MTATQMADRAGRVLYRRPYLYPKQEAAIFHGERYGLVEASTKSGKTVGCLVWLHEQAALGGRPGHNYWWIAPIYSQAKIAYRRLKRFLPADTYVSNETELTVKLANGALIWFKSGKDPDSLYGEDVYAAVIDEASRVKALSWYAIRSTLTATEGPIRIIGNVKGSRNWAYKMARRAEAGAANMHYAKLTVWDAVEAGIFSMDEALDAKANLPPDVFTELYLAEVGDDEAPFFDITKIPVVGAVPPGVKLARAWDFAVTTAKAGRDPDWTVGALLGHAEGRTWIIDVIRKRSDPLESVDLVKKTAAADGRHCTVVIEEEFGAAGKILVAQFKTMLAEVPGAGHVKESKPSGGKLARAFHLAAAANAGKVSLVAAKWNQIFLNEADEFGVDEGEHDDQIDAAAHAYNYLVPSTSPRVRFIG